MTNQPNTPLRARILHEGAKLTTGDRNEQYGDPVDNMQSIGALWSAYLIGKHRGETVDEHSFELSGEDVAHMLTLMKIARTFGPATHYDNFVDSAAYQAIAGECAAEENGDV